MSNRPEITKMLSKSLLKHINPHNDTRIYWSKEVTFDNIALANPLCFSIGERHSHLEII